MVQLTLSNSEIGSHDGNLTKFAAEAIPTAYLLGKFGTQPADVSLCGAGDFPIGIITDTAGAPSSSGVKEPVNVALLGNSNTLLAVANGAIAVGDILVSATGGKVAKLSGEDGVYTMVGVALTAASASDQRIEFISCVPQQYAVSNPE
jgi:hypothetical protein